MRFLLCCYLHVLPKPNFKGKLGILTLDSDSTLLRALTLIANKSGWNTFIATDLSNPMQDLRKIDALVLLPSFDKSLLVKACTVSAVKNVVVCEKHLPSAVTEEFLREVYDHACMRTIERSTLLSKGSIRVHRPDFHRWLKKMHLEKKALPLPNTIFQKITTSSTDLLPLPPSTDLLGLTSVLNPFPS